MKSKISDARPWWIKVAGAFHPADMSGLLDIATAKGFGDGGYADGTHRPNVSTVFLAGSDGELVDQVLERLRQQATILSQLFHVPVWPHLLDGIQVSRYEPGDRYDYHRDHDESGKLLPHDRKISLYVSLTEGGGLAIPGTGRIDCGPGDLLAFTGIITHAAPVQETDWRASFAAWIYGPRWR